MFITQVIISLITLNFIQSSPIQGPSTNVDSGLLTSSSVSNQPVKSVESTATVSDAALEADQASKLTGPAFFNLPMDYFRKS
jgi:hypothetical protein